MRNGSVGERFVWLAGKWARGQCDLNSGLFDSEHVEFSFMIFRSKSVANKYYRFLHVWLAWTLSSKQNLLWLLW